MQDKIFKWQHFAKYLAKPFSMENDTKKFFVRVEVCFIVKYNFIIVILTYT